MLASFYLIQDACGLFVEDYIATTDTAHVSCCAMDGLSGERDSEALGGACSELMTYVEAVEFCAVADMRLCTPTELPVTCGTGCQYDYQMVSNCFCHHILNLQTIRASIAKQGGGNTSIISQLIEEITGK